MIDLLLEIKRAVGTKETADTLKLLDRLKDYCRDRLDFRGLDANY